jgi:hypothetical protein
VAELDPAKVTPAELGAFMTGAHLHEQEQAVEPAAEVHP